MMVLKCICFILVCLDTVSYIVEQAYRIGKERDTYGKICRFLGLCVGIAARVYVLYGACVYWLTA